MGVTHFLVISVIVVLVTFAALCSLRIVPEGKTGVVERFGRFMRISSPGPVWLIPVFETIRLIDMRSIVWPLPHVEVGTADEVVVSVHPVLHYRVTDAYAICYSVQDLAEALQTVVVAAVGALCATMTLDELLSYRSYAGESLVALVEPRVTPWGLTVDRLDLSDVRPPPGYLLS